MKAVQVSLVTLFFLSGFLYFAHAVTASTVSQRTGVQTKDPLVIKADEGEEIDRADSLFERGFDKTAKTKDVLDLVGRATEYFEKHTLAESCRAFTHTKDFLLGDLYVFVLDTKGIVYAHGTKEQFLWKSFYNSVDRFGFHYTQKMIETAESGGGWVVHEYRDSIRSAYVKKVRKDSKDFVIGVGFYTHSKSDTVVELVKGAVAYFNDGIKEGKRPADLFSSYSYPLSDRFIIGDLYLIASDFDGVLMAQGDRPGLIGSNTLNYQDADGLYVNKETIKKLKTTTLGEGVWVEYVSKNAPKQIYAEEVRDQKGKSYFIACGYYPDATREKVLQLVERGYKYMKANGVTAASEKISDKQSDEFRYGDLYLFVYDLKGNCIAHGGSEEFVGKNHFQLQDSDGSYFIQDFINTAKANPKSKNSWSNHRFRNAFQSTYVESVDMGTETYIIGCGYYPLSKRETMVLLAKGAIRHFLEKGDEAFSDFTDLTKSFIRGDLFVFVLDTNGICYAWGDQLRMVWKNLIGWKDEDGKPFIKNMLSVVTHGPTKFAYKLDKRTAVAHVESIEREGKTYIIGSSFFL